MRTFFLHFPEGNRVYICLADEKRRAFDFTDNTFKFRGKLAHIRNTCLNAIGHYEPRADHAYSYVVEIDLSRLLQGTDPKTIPTEGTTVSVHWFHQIGDEPNASTDQRIPNTISLVSERGRFRPATTWDTHSLDEARAFTLREKHAAEYRVFVLREMGTSDSRRERLANAVQSGNVADVLRILGEDIRSWAVNLKPHVLHQITHLAKDPIFVRSRMVPKDAAFQLFETWAVRDWIGSHEAYALLEFHKSADFAHCFSNRLDRLHEARVEFCRNVIDHTVQTRGEDVKGVFAVDEARNNLKVMAFWQARYIDMIASQFDVGNEAGDSPTNLQPTQADQPLVIDESTFTITWKGNGPHDLGNRKEFHLLKQLWLARDRYVSHTDLAELLGGDDNDKITHVKSRLSKFLKLRGLADLVDQIRTQKGYYGLFIS